MNKFVMGCILASGLCFVAGSTFAADATIAAGKKVKFDYTLTVDGQVVETTQGKQPLDYIHGQNQIIPGLEKQLEGMKVGDSKKIIVKPEDGYGPVMKEAFREFEKSKLPKDVEPQVGMMLELKDPEGNAYPAAISEVKETTVMLDFNHPLAGKELTFDVKVVSVE
jgi:FKBP-type peptidyl-prolyl cis-trans isomerase SlyD